MFEVLTNGNLMVNKGSACTFVGLVLSPIHQYVLVLCMGLQIMIDPLGEIILEILQIAAKVVTV